jgi:hypothetical protein
MMESFQNIYQFSIMILLYMIMIQLKMMIFILNQKLKSWNILDQN